jgi:hypothetical protein
MTALIGAAACRAAADGVSQDGKFEVWTGAEAFEQAWSLYSGATLAPFGSIREDGLRLRLVGGYGQYNYQSGPAQAAVTHRGTVSFAELLLGYHAQLGPVTWKVFGGGVVADNVLVPDDPGTDIKGVATGGKAVVETWWTINDRAWAALDLSWSSLHGAYATRGRLGWRLVPALSTGVELAAVGNRESVSTRAGAFLRYEWASGEISATGGVAKDGLLDGLASARALQSGTPFATVTWLTRF